jgi:hypothetical protein
MPKPTKAQALALHNAQMLVFAAADKVFSASPRNDVPFSDCLAMSPPETRAFHAEALAKLESLHSDLIAQKRGYRDQWGHFKAY